LPDNFKDILCRLFRDWSRQEAGELSLLAGSGSNRRYYRIKGKNMTAIGVFNPVVAENKAFLSFTRHFLKKGFLVPAILGESEKNGCYLLQDLGDISLFSLLEKSKGKEGFPGDLLSLYQQALRDLARFQVAGREDLDYSVCYPRRAFDRPAILWDLNYFKYYYLNLAGIPYDEQKLQDDFEALAACLLKADTGYFMYRDFQARNILVHRGNLYYIDYQGGREGALQYDVVSLLFQAKAALPRETREKLLSFYLDEVSRLAPVDRERFMRDYPAYILIRLLQVLGAYGFRGYYERKEHFIESMGFALDNLRWWLGSQHPGAPLPELEKALKNMVARPRVAAIHPDNNLQVSVNSFSYKKGIPPDESGNGGGFVFDCRMLPNPGRQPEFMELTGKSEAVVAFLEKEPAVAGFLSDVYRLVDAGVANYLERGFSHLQVSFGCTGGQHRSVYCAEMLYKHLRNRYPVTLILKHREIQADGQ
jgi:aminoglycoside/choline kinase family phosphotransferase